MTKPGDDLTSLLSSAERSALIVAPFIRTAALARLLDSIPDEVETSVVTRWRPADILAGASDLDIFDLTEARTVPLLLRHDLHAKLFAADDRCLVGSANVTDIALGWRAPSNLELLTPVSRAASRIVAFEDALFAGAVRATREQQDRLRDLVERLSDQPHIVIAETAEDAPTPGLLLPNWAPRTKNPDELYLVYTGDEARVSRTALPAMREELAQLGIVPGIGEADFRAWIAATIAQTPLVGGVMQRIDEEGSMTEAALKQLLDDLGVGAGNYPAHEGLQVLQRWLTHFLPAQYQTTQDSIKLIQAKKV